MLKGISPLISPELLATLASMGHGDEIVLADAHFPGHSCNENVIRADGLMIDDLLEAILPLYELDHAIDDPVRMMQPSDEELADGSIASAYEAVVSGYQATLDKAASGKPSISRISRFEFYDHASTSFAVVMTGDTRIYANLLLAKGVTPTE